MEKKSVILLMKLKMKSILLLFNEKTINHWYSGANCTGSYFY